jgi:hypothetical protein
VTAGRIAAALFAVLVAATVVVLVVSQNVRSGVVVDQVEVTNELVAGQGRAAKVRFRLTEDEPRGTVEVLDEDREVVATLAEAEPLGDYEIHRFRWTPGPDAKPGSYRVRLALDSLDREIVLPEEVDVRRDG